MYTLLYFPGAVCRLDGVEEKNRLWYCGAVHVFSYVSSNTKGFTALTLHIDFYALFHSDISILSSFHFPVPILTRLTQYSSFAL